MAFADQLVAKAQAELEFWKNGGLVECSADKPQGSHRVRRYWQDGLHIMNLDGCDTDTPWSAAFICFCMQAAGMPLSEFPFSASHQAYIRWAVNNAKGNKPNKTFYGRRRTERAPQPGDLIAQWRTPASSPPPSFNNMPEGFFASHCDIVVEANDHEVIAVGGNVSQRVKTTRFPAQNGILASFPSFICVMECAKT